MSANEESLNSISDRMVEPMEVDIQTGPPPIGKLLKATDLQEGHLDSYYTSKSASENVSVAVNVPRSQPRLNSPAVRNRTAVSKPGNARQVSRSPMGSVRSSGSSLLATGLSVPSPGVRPARIASPLVKTGVGQRVEAQNSYVMSPDGSCVVFQVSDSGSKLAYSTVTINSNKQQPSDSGVKTITSPSKVTRTPSIISRGKSTKKPPASSDSLSALPAVGNASSPAAASQFARSSLLASSSNIVIMNSPVTATASPPVVVTTLPPVAVDIGNSGRIIRLAGTRNFGLSPLGSCALKPAAGAVRLPVSHPSPAALPGHRYVLTKSAGSHHFPPQVALGTGRPMSPLTSFRMQTIRKQPQVPAVGHGAVGHGGLVEVRPTVKEPEKHALKRVAASSIGSSSDESLQPPKKKRKFVPGKAYSVTFPGGDKKFVGFWENNMIRNFSGMPKETSGLTEKDVGTSATSRDVCALGSKSGTDAGILNATSAKALVDEIADLSKDRFYYCAKCQTLTSNNVPCVTCNVLPVPCLTMPQTLLSAVPESPKKSLVVDPSSAAASPAVPSVVSPAATLLQQRATNSAQLKSLQRIFVMQSGKQIQIMRKIPEQLASSPALRLTVPVRFQGATIAPGLQANARAPSTALRPIRKTVFEVQKRTEPDVVQILSSDDEDNQASQPDSQSIIPSSAPLSSASGAAVSTTATPQDSQDRQSDEPTLEASAAHQGPMVSLSDFLLSIKIRIVRFGTLQRGSANECQLLVGGIKIGFDKDEDLGCCSLLIPAADLRAIRVHYGPCGPVLFLHSLPGVAAQLREIIPFQDHCFDPDHKDDACRYITIIPDKNQVTDEKDVSAMFEKMQAACPVGRKFVVQTITGDVASQLLKAKRSPLSLGTTPTQTVFYITANGQIIQRQVMPGELVAKPTEGDEEEEVADRSRSPSPPHPTFIGPIIKLFTYPPPPATGGITVTNEDFFCLKDGEFLNDVVIDFYLKYLQREVLSKEDRERTHVFSSFFYRRLVQKQANEQKDSTMTLQQLRHCRVKKWTKHVDLFSKDFIIVPINESAHWYLAIVCFPGRGGICPAEQTDNSPAVTSTNECHQDTVAEQEDNSQKQDVPSNDTDLNDSVKKPCILIFDSLAMPTRYSVVRTLREYLQCEWDAKKKAKEGCRNYNKDSMQGACPRCPRQTNFSDCGVYVLQYVESFFNDPIRNFTLPISALATWFSEELIVSKRELLRQLVLRLQKGLNPKLDFDPCQNSVDALTTGATVQLLNPAPETPVEEASAGQINSVGGMAAVGSSDPSGEQLPVAMDGVECDVTVAEGSGVSSTQKSEMNNTHPDGVSENVVSAVQSSPNLVVSVPDVFATPASVDASQVIDCEAGEAVVGGLVCTPMSLQNCGLSHNSNLSAAPHTEGGENEVATWQTPASPKDVGPETANARAFSAAVGTVSSERCSNSDSFDLQDIQTSQSEPVIDIGKEVENATSSFNGRLVVPSIAQPFNESPSLDQNSAAGFCETVKSDACEPSETFSSDAGNGFDNCKEAFVLDGTANELSASFCDKPS